MAWRDHNDFLKDIWAISEMEGISGHHKVVETPDSILEYRAQMSANNSGSIYDNPQPEEKGVTYIMSGRGRGVISTIFRPGDSDSHLSDESVTEDVLRKIRQVSGLGYSNSLIEQGVRAMTIANNKKTQEPSDPSRPTSSRSSPRRTPNNTPALYTPLENGRNSPSSSSLGSVSPCAPPPLSVMLKNAQKSRQKQKDDAPEKDDVAGAENTRATTSKTRKKTGRLSNGSFSPPVEPGSSSDEGSWRRGRQRSADALFSSSSSSNFFLNCDDFPALK